MSGQITGKTFSGGMNKDLDYSLLKDDQYIDAQNYKLISDETANGFALENAEGNVIWLDVSGVSGLDNSYNMVGHCFIQPYLVLFYTNNGPDRTPEGISKILRVTIDKDVVQESTIIYDDSTVTGTLDIGTTYPIKAVGHYESNDNIKVYWVDGYNDMRWMNIMDSNLSSYDTHMLDLVPDFPLDTTNIGGVKPTFNSYINGALNCSSIQYAYQYYIPNGPTTVWSPSSYMIQVPETNSKESDKVAGGDKGDNSDYGVAIDIDIVSSDFSKLRVVALQYGSYNGTPTVRIFEDRDITSSSVYTLTINDVGDTLDELTYDEYLIQTNSAFSAKDLAIKDNYLFAANIRETFFDADIDTRAYRHVESGAGAFARLYSSNLVDYIDVKDAGGYDATFSQVSATHDCINLYNKSVYNSVEDEHANHLVYQADGATIGAEGSNFKITPTIDSGDCMDSLGTTLDNIWTAVDFLYEPGQKSWQRNEVYRIGVILRNSKLQASPAKWVCDFKVPSFGEEARYKLTDVNGGNTYRVRIGLQLDYIGAADLADFDVSSFEIVVVPRATGDRSILAQGIVQHSYDDSPDYSGYSDMVTEDITARTSGSEDILKFLSPEISFNKNLEFQEHDFVHYVGYFGHTSANTSFYDGMNYEKVFNHTSWLVSTLNATKKKEIDGGSIIGYVADDSYRINIDNKSYKPYIESIPVQETGPCTTHFAFSVNGDSLTNWWTSTDDRVALANYKRDIFESQYGGIDYYSRLNSIYVSVSNLVLTGASNAYTISYDGDTYIDWFNYVNTCNDLDKTELDTQACTYIFPVESSISLSHRVDDGLHRNVGNVNARLLQEISGEWESDCIDGIDRSYTQESALYQYNPVYSQQNRSSFYYPATENFKAIQHFSTRIKNSELKINGENIDSFTIFKPNNFIDVTGKFGPINNIEVFINRLYFWQNSGFGIASVNTRSLIEDNQPGTLALGVGGILDRVDYISDIIGNQNQYGIAKSTQSMYWVDNNKNEFFKYTGSLESVSKMGGIQTWINEQGQIGNVNIIYDHKYNDVIFTVTFSRLLTCTDVLGEYADDFSITPDDLSTGSIYDVRLNGRYLEGKILPENNILSYFSGAWHAIESPFGIVGSKFYVTVDNDSAMTYTITFNELADSFVSFNSFTPYRYIRIASNFLSTTSLDDIYIHNVDAASRSTYYDITYDSEFTTVFNKDFPYTKVWDGMKWYTESVDSANINQFKDTFDTLTISNDYQHTGDRDLYYKGGSVPSTRPTEIVRRDRTFSMQIPRNIVDIDISSNPDITDSGNWDETQTFKERIRSKYILFNTTYDNTNDNTFSVPFIASIFRKSVR